MLRSQRAVIKKTIAYLKRELGKDSSGHDWWHVFRVNELAKRIAEKEKVDIFIVELASLLHDIADYKLHDGNEEIGPEKAKEWLEKNKVKPEDISRVVDIIKEISFKGANVKFKPSSREAMVVQDADRLDAIGAIGIARTFAYGGHKGRLIYDPEINPKLHNSFEEYKNNTSPTINHFYEKLLLLEKLMNTEYAKKIARDRTSFMEKFLKKFFLEWEGKI